MKLCPYCQGDMSNAHHAMMTESSIPKDEDIVTICVECGEPIFIDAKHREDGFRKPTFEELEELIKQPRYHAMRAGWLHLREMKKQGGDTPVEAEWQRFYEHFNLEQVGMNPDQLNVAQQIFMLSFSRAVTVMNEIYDSDDIPWAQTRLALIKAELNAYYESINKEMEDESRHHSQRHGNVAG